MPEEVKEKKKPNKCELRLKSPPPCDGTRGDLSGWVLCHAVDTLKKEGLNPFKDIERRSELMKKWWGEAKSKCPSRQK